MTDLPEPINGEAQPVTPARPAATPPARRRPRALPTFLAAIALFGVIFELLAFQLASGHDPAVSGSAAQAVATKPAPNKRVVVTRVVTDVVPAQPTASSTPTATASTSAPVSSGSAPAAPAPSSAPAPAPAPAPAAAPAPAPAPATAVTSTS